MTTATTDQEITEQAASEAFSELVRIERAVNRAYQEIADSLGLKDRAAVNRHIKSLEDTAKQYLVSSGEKYLHDGEFDVTRRIKPKAEITYFLNRLVETDEGKEALAKAAAQGWLKLDNKAFEKFRSASGTDGGGEWVARIWAHRNANGATWVWEPLEWGRGK